MLDLSEITRVEDLTSSEDVNAYLAIGWKILNTYTRTYDTEGPAVKHQTLHIVMAWCGADPQYPEKKENPYHSVGTWF